MSIEHNNPVCIYTDVNGGVKAGCIPTCLQAPHAAPTVAAAAALLSGRLVSNRDPSPPAWC